MDERLRQIYHQIYSELFLIILLLAAASLIIKTLVYGQTLPQTWFEYVILVGSPLYRAVRRGMLGAAGEQTSTKNFAIRLAAAMTAAVLLILLAVYLRTGTLGNGALFAFLGVYLVLMLVVALVGKKINSCWQKKMDEKYR